MVVCIAHCTTARRRCQRVVPFDTLEYITLSCKCQLFFANFFIFLQRGFSRSLCCFQCSRRLDFPFRQAYDSKFLLHCQHIFSKNFRFVTMHNLRVFELCKVLHGGGVETKCCNCNSCAVAGRQRGGAEKGYIALRYIEVQYTGGASAFERWRRAPRGLHPADQGGSVPSICRYISISRPFFARLRPVSRLKIHRSKIPKALAKSRFLLIGRHLGTSSIYTLTTSAL